MKVKNLYKLVFLVFLFVLSGCNFNNSNTITQTEQTTTETTIQQTTSEIITESNLTIQLKNIYKLAVDADAFDGTYEDWIETVRGPQGIPGEDGREILLRSDNGYIQWQYSGDSTWTNLIETSILVGPAGSNGSDGKSAYEIYLENYPEYTGSESEWLNDLIDGNLGLQQTYLVSFDSNGGTEVPSQIVSDNDKANKPDNPIREGCIFEGWFINGDEAWVFGGYDVTEDITLVAHWIVPYEVTLNNIIYRVLDNDATVIGFTGTETDIILPSTLGGGVNVVAIGDFALSTNINIQSIILPDTVTSIGKEAFSWCFNLEYILLPIKLDVIGENAFFHVADMIFFDVPVENQYFVFEDYTLFSKDKTILYKHNNVSDVTDYIVPDGVQIIKETAFDSNRHLNTITIPASVETIMKSFTYDCDLFAIYVDENNPYFTSIDGVLYDKNISKIIVYPSKKTNISFTVPGTVETIGYEAFRDSRNLQVITLPENLNEIGWAAFDYCEELTKILIPDTVSVIQNYAFHNILGMTIYTEAVSQPESWFAEWNSEDHPVVWGYVETNTTITFDTNGGSDVSPITQNIFSTVTMPNIPTKIDYDFSGWFTDLELTHEYEFNIMPDTDITLYVKWNPIDYHITYQLDGGTNGINPDTYTIETPSIILDNPVKVGYIFDGWFDNAEYLGTAITEISLGTAGDITLYAKWIFNQFSVTYTDFDGSILQTAEYDYQTNIEGVNPPDNPTRIGYTFNAWDTTLPATMPANDIVITASYTINQYDIIYTESLNYDLISGILLNPDEIIINVSMGTTFMSVITSDGRVFMWGENHLGQLGDGTTIDRPTPIDISSQFNLNENEIITRIILGAYYSFAISSENRIFAWGYNNHGQLGDGTITTQLTPIDITSQFNLNEEETIIDMSLGTYFSSAITSEGRIFTWGWNIYGQLGDGTTIDRHSPSEITSQFNLNEGETIELFTFGGWIGSVLTSEGRVFTWGRNLYGILGDGTTTTQLTPIDITSQFNLNEEETIIDISLGYYHSSALSSEGRVFTWGNNTNGQLGDGTTTDRYVPTDITSHFNLHSEEKVTIVHLGSNNSLALTSEGRVYTWGSNTYGQVGDGTISERHLPTDITSQFSLSDGESIINVWGRSFSLAFTSEANLFVWGDNRFGQLGDGTTTESTTPEEFLQVEVDVILIDTYDYNTIVTEFLGLYKEGYTFGGWYSDIALTIPYTFTTMPNEDIILYAKWSINQYMITFDSNGGSEVSSIIQVYNTSVTEPEDPTKEGYTFDGWYSDSELTVPYIFSTMPADDLSIYAKWILEATDFTFIFKEDSTYEITGYSGSDTEIIIPASYAGYPVTSIGVEAFYENTSITSVTIPEGITLIDEGAFYGCTALVSITLPSTLTTIEYHAIGGCSSLTEIIIPITVTAMGGRVFDRSSNITIIVVASSKPAGWANDWNSSGTFSDPLPVVWGYSFTAKTITYETNGGTAVESIREEPGTALTEPVDPFKADYFFDGWYSDSGLTVPYIFTTMPEEDITIYAKWVLDVSDFTFTFKEDSTYEITGYIGSDTEIIIPITHAGYPVTSIGVDAFYENTSITSVTIPEGITLIDEGAFYGCTALVSITLPSTLTTIEYHAIGGCSNLTEIIIPITVTAMGGRVFDRSSNITINVVASSKPAGWANDWNSSGTFSDPLPVVWGYSD